MVDALVNCAGGCNEADAEYICPDAILRARGARGKRQGQEKDQKREPVYAGNDPFILRPLFSKGIFDLLRSTLIYRANPAFVPGFSTAIVRAATL